jgi:predicted ribosome-associated RNA-binding protein Tma20
MVIAKLTGGADLMIPGIAPQSLEQLPKLREGALVSVNSVSEPGVPRAVGQLAVSSSELRLDDKGKAVLTVRLAFPSLKLPLLILRHAF